MAGWYCSEGIEDDKVVLAGMSDSSGMGGYNRKKNLFKMDDFHHTCRCLERLVWGDRGTSGRHFHRHILIRSLGSNRRSAGKWRWPVLSF